MKHNGEFSNEFNMEYYQEFTSSKTTEQNRLLFYLKPHHTDPDDIYGLNSLSWLFLNPVIDKKAWPQMPPCSISNVSKSQKIMDFYQGLRDSMASEYCKHLIEIGEMHPYQTISTFKNMIDITKQVKKETDCSDVKGYKTYYVGIHLADEEFDILRQIGWKCFLPFTDELVIKVTKWRYFFIQTRNLRNKSFELTIYDYIGNKREWMLQRVFTAQLNFGTENADGLPLGWNIISAKSFGHIVTEHVPEMKWDDRKKAFWYDLCGFYGQEHLTTVRLYEPDLESEKPKFIKDSFFDINLTSQAAVQAIVKSKYTGATVIKSGQDAIDDQNDSLVESYLKTYCNIICAFMLSAVDKDVKPYKTEDGKWNLDDIIVKTEDDQLFQNWLFSDDIRGKFVK